MAPIKNQMSMNGCKTISMEINDNERGCGTIGQPLQILSELYAKPVLSRDLQISALPPRLLDPQPALNHLEKKLTSWHSLLKI